MGTSEDPESSENSNRPRLVEGEERRVHEEMIEQRLGGGNVSADEEFEEEERKIHKEMIEKRLGGGDVATEEKYARALKQWQDLPGSVVRPPTDVKLPTKQRTNVNDNINDSKEKRNEENNGDPSS